MKFSSEFPYFCLFLLSLWLTGELFHDLLRCRLIGELFIGLVFGNLAVGTLLPSDKTFLIFVGELGVLGLVFEAGLSTDIRRVIKAGPRSVLIAGLGIVVPLATGFGLMYGILQQDRIQKMIEAESVYSNGGSGTYNIVIEAIASGASLASTSIAVAVTMMKQQGILDTTVGTLITTAAMLDDVVSLILLGIVSNMGGSGNESSGGIKPMTVILPLLASLGIIIVGTIACVIVSKIKARKMLPSSQLDTEMSNANNITEGVDVPENRTIASSTDKDVYQEKKSKNRHKFKTSFLGIYSRYASTIQLAGVIIVGLGYSILAEYLGSSRLLGAFVSGVLFSAFENIRKIYDERIIQTLQPALSAIFFATIGFAIPLIKILDPVLFGWGVLYAVIASLSKLSTAFVVPTKLPSQSLDGQYNTRWVVGTAMIARGELGLLMVQQAQAEGVMSQTAMVITTWSIVLATLVGIGAFTIVMQRSNSQNLFI
ncbi:hypothetical protein FBU30_009698 [Linnemannia zychae]|nr:hypothetical protein FBU30_009698 [Linnemannia zychae]